MFLSTQVFQIREGGLFKLDLWLMIVPFDQLTSEFMKMMQILCIIACIADGQPPVDIAGSGCVNVFTGLSHVTCHTPCFHR